MFRVERSQCNTYVVWWWYMIYAIVISSVDVDTKAHIKPGETVPCPGEDDVICTECNCNNGTGFNTCVPIHVCPKPVTKTSKIRKKNKESKCPHGSEFTAQCTLCECSGHGSDHCAICYALPVKRNGQPEDLNNRLPQVTDNRFFNYEINGWDAPKDDK